MYAGVHMNSININGYYDNVHNAHMEHSTHKQDYITYHKIDFGMIYNSRYVTNKEVITKDIVNMIKGVRIVLRTRFEFSRARRLDRLKRLSGLA